MTWQAPVYFGRSTYYTTEASPSLLLTVRHTTAPPSYPALAQLTCTRVSLVVVMMQLHRNESVSRLPLRLRVVTVDGSAVAGQDFQLVDQVMRMEGDQDSMQVGRRRGKDCFVAVLELNHRMV